jgi:hypothetical protein
MKAHPHRVQGKHRIRVRVRSTSDKYEQYSQENCLTFEKACY